MMINRSEIGKNRDRKKQRRGCPTTSQGDFSWNLKKKQTQKTTKMAILGANETMA